MFMFDLRSCCRFCSSIVSVSCGYAHTIFLTKSGDLYLCGNNLYGQLALGTVRKQSLPVRLDRRRWFNDESSVRLATSGLFHTVVCTESGRLFTWGATPQSLKFKALLKKRRSAGVNHRVALSEGSSLVEIIHMEPTEIQLTGNLLARTDQIVQIDCGTHHSAAVTQSGNLYTWGKSLEMQLGHGDKKERQSPTMLVDVHDDKQWRFVACGSEFTMAVDARSVVWSWGRNDVCQLGFRSSITEGMSTLAGKVLTIRRNVGQGTGITQRTITLPTDRRTIVARPVALDGCLVDVDASIAHAEIEANWGLDRFLSGCKRFGCRLDQDYADWICHRFSSARRLLAYLRLASGDVSGSIDALSNLNVDAHLADFYEPFVHLTGSDTVNSALSFIDNLPAPMANKETAIGNNLATWAATLNSILNTHPQRLNGLSCSLKLRALKFKLRPLRNKVDTVEIDQHEFLTADRTVHRFACGHLLSDRTLQCQLGELQTEHRLNCRLPRTASLANRLYSQMNDVNGKEFDSINTAIVCPKCLGEMLVNIIDEIPA